MRLRIVSDGRPSGTRLYDADTGEEVDLMVRAVSWSVSALEPASATLELIDVEIEASGAVESLDDWRKERLHRLTS